MKDWIELLLPPVLGVAIGCAIVIFANWIHLGTIVFQMFK